MTEAREPAAIEDARRMGTFDKIGRSKLAVAAGVLVVAGLVAGAIGTLASGKLHYSNYWGGRVFAPFVFLVIGLLIVVLAKAFSDRDKPVSKLRGRAARKARQAEATRFPIDDYKKW